MAALIYLSIYFVYCLTAWGAVGSGQWNACGIVPHCCAQWNLLCSLPHVPHVLPWGSGQWNSFCTPPHCLGVVGSGTPSVRCLTALVWWTAELLPSLPHCLGAVGIGAPSNYYFSALGQWEVEVLLYTASVPLGSGQCNSFCTMSHCHGVVCSGTASVQCLTTLVRWTAERLPFTASLSWGPKHWNSF